MANHQIAVSALSLSKTYEYGDITVEVFKDVNFEIKEGEFAVLGGPSGCGKTTLLNIVGGIDKPTSGKISVFGEDISVKDEDFLANFRCNNIGFVFQSYNLVSTLTSAENISFPMEWNRKEPEYIEKRVLKLLDLVGLPNRARHFPCQLSGGELQRVAFARALANDPPLLLVDEPTGNLDVRTSKKIVQLLQALKDAEKTVLVATHDVEISKMAGQHLFLEEGRLINGQ